VIRKHRTTNKRLLQKMGRVLTTDVIGKGNSFPPNRSGWSNGPHVFATNASAVIYCPNCFSPIVNHPISIRTHAERVHRELELAQ
jgi:hypothetical protein